MVEPSRNCFASGASTPTQSRFGLKAGQLRHREKPGSSSASPTPLSSPVIDSSSRQHTAQSDSRTFPSRAPFDHLVPAMADAQGDTQNSPKSGPDASRIESTHQQTYPQSFPEHSSYSPFQAPPSGIEPSTSSSDNIHSAVPHHTTAALPYYTHRGGYNPPTYTTQTQPSSTLGHAPPFVVYQAAFPDPRVPDGGVPSQNPHIHYQPMLQPHVPIYYQPHPSPAPMRGHFQHMHYPPPHSSPQFSYGGQGFPSAYSPYPSHQPYSRPDAESQGTWYYLPHSIQQHPEGSPITYQGHYPNLYPSMRAPDAEPENPALAASRDPATHSLSDPQEPMRVPGADRHPRSTPSGLPNLSPSFVNAEQGGVLGAEAGRTSPSRRRDQPIARKAYHPNPPPHRSEWVMWVGNIPSDATHDELWRFFNQPTASNPGEDRKSTSQFSSDQRRGSGVISIFLISKSSCVFVNYHTEVHLTRAIGKFNGRPLRAHDPRCLRLVCRVRKRDDDLKAGVGGQRGQGLHVRWVKDQKLKEKQVQSAVLSPDEHSHSQASGLDSFGQLTLHTSDLDLSSDDEGKRKVQPSHRSSSGSHASTDSSFLSNFFPKRYFILKSLTQYDLDLSVQQGLWATQKHNEGILDQAYRTSKDVFLIFGVNKSGEFYGYARMAGPVQHGAKNVPWASRVKDSTSRHSRHPSQSDPTEQVLQSPSSALEDTRVVSNTPAVVPGDDDDVSPEARTPGPRRDLYSAPAGLSHARQLSTRSAVPKSMTLPDEQTNFELDPGAPLRAVRAGVGSASARIASPLGIVEEHDELDDDTGAENEPQQEEDTWGDCFKVDWLCTERLPFYWTRNLRNPWNHDREVKISRDGTEMEPTIGEMLLNAWEIMRAEGGEIPHDTPGQSNPSRKSGQSRRQTDGGRPRAQDAKGFI